MIGRRLAILMAVAVFAAFALTQLCCTPSDESVQPGDIGIVPLGPGAPGPITPSPVRAPAGRRRKASIPAPVRGKTVEGGELPKLASFPGDFKLGDGVTFGPVRIFPIYAAAQPQGSQDYLTLAEAQKKKQVEISELERGATVNSVEIKNKSDKPIYVVSGDIIKGGNQDRVIAMDMVIPPGKNQLVAAEAFCVEHGRWTAGYSGTYFNGDVGLSCYSLRSCLARSSASQGEVWENVSEANAALGTENSTGTYRAALEDGRVNSKLEPYVKAFMQEFEKDEKVVGFAVCAGKKVLACDIFLNPSLFSQMREKLIRSYVMGALTREKPGSAAVTARDVAKFLEKAAKARVTLKKQDKNCKVFSLKYGKTEGFFTEVGEKKTHFFLGGR